MRLLLTILFFSVLQTFAATVPTTYYVAVFGQAGYTGKSESSPWSIEKLNASWSIIQPGDRILFKRDDTFFGTLTIGKAGTAGNPIYIGAYGTGAKPIFSNLTPLSGWVNSGSGIWTSTGDPSLPSDVNIVFLNGVSQNIGRYPNESEPRKGYLKYEDQGRKYITDNELPSSPNWTGAEVVIRSRHWVHDIKKVNSHVGHTINVDSSYYIPDDEGGYFFQNDIKTLDKYGEWCYNATAKTVTKMDGTTTTVPAKSISIYLGTTFPAGATIQACSGDIGFKTSYSFITFENIAVYGQNSYGIQISGSKNNVRILNCDINGIGKEGVNAYSGDINNCSVIGCNISDIYSNGITFKGNSDTSMDNHIDKVYAVAGMGGSGDGQGLGIEHVGSYHYIAFNEVTRIGYIGINYSPDRTNGGSYNQVRNNYVDSFCYTKDDGGGIYTFNSIRGTAIIPTTGNVIDGNIVTNGIGITAGTAADYASKPRASAEGIYFDGRSQGILVTNNSVGNVTNKGLFFNNTRNIVCRNNTIFNTGNAFYLRSYDSTSTGAKMDGSNALVGNIALSFKTTTDNSQDKVLFYTSPFRDIQNWGKIDSNYYCQPLNEPTGVTTSSGGAIRSTYESTNTHNWYSLDKWQVATLWNNSTRLNYDLHTFKTIKTITSTSEVRFEYNPSKTAKTISLNGKTYIDPTGKESFKSGSITLEPYTSKILIVTPNVPLDNSNTYPTVNITSPVNNSSYTTPLNLVINATASDAGGSISKVEFYNGATLLGSDVTSPYSFTWNGVPGGIYQVTAKAYDNTNLSTVSSVVNVNVTNANVPPKVLLTSPVNAGKYIAPASIQITATASDTDGTVTKVEYYNGSTLIHTENNAPYDWAWTSVAVGSYTITAKAYDDKGAVTTSAPANISVRNLTAPDVTVTSPTDNANYVAPATINISATATDPDGNVTKVEFYNNGVLINTDVTAPYSYTLTNVQTGTVSIQAKAYDNDGQSSVSSVVAVVSAPPKKAPTVSITSPATGANYSDPAEVVINATASDADGTITRVDFYRDTILIGSDNTAPYSITWSSALSGNYSLTARAVDNDTLTTISIAVPISITHANQPPIIDVIDPTDSVQAGNDVILTFNATDADGSISNVKFYANGNLISTVSNAPYMLIISLPAGVYNISAVATDDKGATATKNVTYTVYNPAPGSPIILKGHKGILTP